jgi:hypothetical protein
MIILRGRLSSQAISLFAMCYLAETRSGDRLYAVAPLPRAGRATQIRRATSAKDINGVVISVCYWVGL